ncbi:MAG: arylsulfatase, partial [Planctomycetota bacterium]
KAPSDRTLDGFDLSPLLTGGAAKSPRDKVYYWRSEVLYAIRVGPWKAHFVTQGCYGIGPKRVVHQSPELYNLEFDPSEKYNVAAQHPDVVKRLSKLAKEHEATIEKAPNELIKR